MATEHKWTGCQMGGSPANAESYEWICYCSVCGMEDTCEDPLPPCPGPESNQKEPLDLHALHTLYSGCTPQEKCELIERIWKLEEVVRALRQSLQNSERVISSLDVYRRYGPMCEDNVNSIARADDILKGRPA